MGTSVLKAPSTNAQAQAQAAYNDGAFWDMELTDGWTSATGNTGANYVPAPGIARGFLVLGATGVVAIQTAGGATQLINVLSGMVGMPQHYALQKIYYLTATGPTGATGSTTCTQVYALA